MFFKRYEKNPILGPEESHSWEATACFNGCPVVKDGKIFLLYRALSLPEYYSPARQPISISTIGVAESDDGLNFSNRRQLIVPENDWERFGCEDPRVTYFEGRFFIFYTALSDFPFRVSGIKIGLGVSEDLQTIAEKHLVTPFNSKAMALFPERVKGKIWAVLTANTDQPPSIVALIPFSSTKEIYSRDYWIDWYHHIDRFSLDLRRSPYDHIEVGSPPIKTKKGWLLFYSYIRNYFSGKKLFTIEAVLLDKKNPLKIVSRTQFPLMTPEQEYERFGMVPGVIFPSGALEKENTLRLYYGAADLTCCVAQTETDRLLDILTSPPQAQFSFKRFKRNPLLTPDSSHNWENKAVFNPAAIVLDRKVHILYRAMGSDNTSVFGYAVSSNGKKIDYRSDSPVYTPREPFEQKLIPGANSGCEDPRITLVDDDIYVTYTAFDGKNAPRVALTKIKKEKFLNQQWDWEKPILVSPPNVADKDAALLPEKVNDKYLFFHRLGNDIDIYFFDSLDFDELSRQPIIEERRWLQPRPGMWDSEKVGIASPPLKTEYGWILFYHGFSMPEKIYRVGAVLLDIAQPTKILARTIYPIFEPETPYEKQGQVRDVVFPCGAVIIGKEVFLYYGGADSVVAGAELSLKKIITELERGRY